MVDGAKYSSDSPSSPPTTDALALHTAARQTHALSTCPAPRCAHAGAGTGTGGPVRDARHVGVGGHRVASSRCFAVVRARRALRSTEGQWPQFAKPPQVQCSTEGARAGGQQNASMAVSRCVGPQWASTNVASGTRSGHGDDGRVLFWMQLNCRFIRDVLRVI